MNNEDQEKIRLTRGGFLQPVSAAVAATGRLIGATVLGIGLAIAVLPACTTVETRSMDDVKGLAGTWQGNGYATDSSFLFMSLVIGEDGSYELTGSMTSKGMIKVDRDYFKVGPFNLWLHTSRGSRTLKGTGNGAQVAFYVRGYGPM